jgi:hypothetical protein
MLDVRRKEYLRLGVASADNSRKQQNGNVNNAVKLTQSMELLNAASRHN